MRPITRRYRSYKRRVIAEYEKITSQEPEASDEQAIYLARPCPRCKGYLGIVLHEPGAIHSCALSRDTGAASLKLTIGG